MKFQKILENEAETAQLAQKISAYLFAGDVIRLEGDLGAGKSTFARALIQALGHKGSVPSPTFTLMQTYEDTRLPIAHLDCYRIEDPAELEALDLHLYLAHAVTVVEWPEKGGEIFSQNRPDALDYHILSMDNAGTLTINLKEISPEKREVTFTASPSWVPRLALVEKSWSRAVTTEGRLEFLAHHGRTPEKLEKASPGDWSMRSYWRYEHNGKTEILVDSPTPLEDIKSKIQLVEIYNKIGIKVPQIYAADEAKGYIIEEDFGPQRLLPFVEGLPEEEKEPWLRAALDFLVDVKTKSTAVKMRSYTVEDFFLEAARFVDCTLPAMTGHATPVEEREAFHRAMVPLIQKILAVPQTLTHWDYHADNIMVLNPQKPAVESLGLIDFQDARLGPASYDVASFLKNDRLPIAPQVAEKLLEETMQKMGIEDKEGFKESCELIALQRTFKILGGLMRLAVRDGRTDLLDLLPRCWCILNEGLIKLEGTELARWAQKNIPENKTVLALKTGN